MNYGWDVLNFSLKKVIKGAFQIYSANCIQMITCTIWFSKVLEFKLSAYFMCVGANWNPEGSCQAKVR